MLDFKTQSSLPELVAFFEEEEEELRRRSRSRRRTRPEAENGDDDKEDSHGSDPGPSSVGRIEEVQRVREA
jgi:hypothetical protein